MAYTKYSLTPANNNATPPDGAPEGMLPSAVNDTMRDMMAQIRDVGDGIRNGTYTMTAPVITGGSITGVALSGNTFTNPVITGGSINNTPIGASTANTGAFTTLSASGVATFSAGTVSAPAITTTGDTNTGIFFPAADTIAFTEGGVESMRIDSSGNVGIGTSSPTANRRLDAVISSNASAGIRVTNSNAGTATSSNTSYSNGTFNHEFGILGTGYTTYGVLVASDAYIYSSGNNISFGADGASAVIKFGTGSGIPERMRIDSSGNVGIGTSSPSTRLSISYTANARGGVAITTTNNSGTSEQGGFLVTNGNGAGLFSGVNGAAYTTGGIGAANEAVAYSIGNVGLAFGTNTTERMRIDSAGRVLVGLTSANTSGANFQVSSGVTFPATQSASSDANTLDDYEEGTWTPTIIGTATTGTVTYDTRNARYTKIGRVVQIECYLGWSNGTGSGSLRIGNLPFTNSASGTFPAMTISYPNNLALTANNVLTAHVDTGATTINFFQYPVGGGAATAVNYDAAGEILVCGTYSV